MAARSKKIPAETHESIAEQTAAFLEAGGEIQRIARGVSSPKRPSGPRQIVLGKSSPKKDD
jgi:hypothetical protein